MKNMNNNNEHEYYGSDNKNKRMNSLQTFTYVHKLATSQLLSPITITSIDPNQMMIYLPHKIRFCTIVATAKKHIL